MRKVYLLIVLLLSAFASHAQYIPASPPLTCSNQLFSWNDTSPGGFPAGQYIWDAPTGVGFIGGSANSVPKNSVSGTLINLTSANVIASYVVKEIGSSTTFTLNVTIYPSPDVTISTSSQVILNGTATTAISFGSSVPVATTFNWTNSNTTIGLVASGISSSIGSFIALNNTLNPIISNLTVTPKANGCSGTTKSFTIKVDPTTVTICSGTNINFSDLSVFSTLPENFSWPAPASPAGVTGVSPSAGSPTVSQTLFNTNNIQKTLTYSVLEGSTGTTFTLIVNVNPAPDIITSSSQIVCNGSLTSPVAFSSTTTIAGTSYSWTNDSPTIGIPATGNGAIAAFPAANSSSSPITATINVTPSANSCSGISQAFTIVINPTPVLNSSLTPTALCNNSLFTYIGSSATTGTSFTWARPVIPNTNLTNPNGSFPGTGNSISETIANNSVTAVNVVYTFTLTANGCSNSQNVTLSINPTPFLTSALNPTAICSNSVFSYIATSSPVSASAVWSMPSVTGVSNLGALTGTGNISQTLVNNTNAPIPVSFYYTVSINGCVNSNVFTGTFNLNPLPALNNTLTPTAICSGSTFTYIASSNSLATPTYTWTRSAVGGITSGGGTSGTQNISQTLFNNNLPITPVTYTYTLIASGCSNTQNVTVNVYPVPVLSSTLVPSPVCSGTVFDYSPTNILPGTLFNWVRTVTTGISNPAASGANDPAETLINTTIAPVTAGYTYTLITTNGCTNSQTFTVTVNPTPTLSSSLTPPAICTGSLFSYTPQSNTTGTLFNFTRLQVSPITNPFYLGSNNPNEILVNPTNTPATATYNYTLTANGCGNTQSVNVVVNPVPVVAAQTTATCSNMAFSFMPPNVPSGTVYTWGAPSITPAGSVAGGGAQASGQSAISQTYSNQTITAATALYTVVPTASGCSGIPFSVTVTINPVPFVGNQLLTAICSGTSFSFSATNTQVPIGTTYTWFNPALGPLNSLTGVSAQPISQPAVSQTLTSSNKLMDTAYYTVVPATAFCIGNAFSITVPVKPLPVIIDQRDTICSGASFFVSPSSGLNNTTFTWAAPVSTPAGSITGGFAQTLPVSSISQTLLNVTSSVAQTVYTIIPSVANCAGPSFSLIETVSRPIPLFGNIPVQICSGTPFNATPATAPSGTTYTWTIPSSNPTGGVIGVSAASTPQTAVSQTLSNVLGVTETVVYTVLPFLNNCQGPSFHRHHQCGSYSKS